MDRRDTLERMAQRGKYAPLYNDLKVRAGAEWPTTFSEIERILGFRLPASARVHRPWWANQGTRGAVSQCLAWEMAGWKASQVDMEGERVVFLRSENADISQIVSDGGDDVSGDLSPPLRSDNSVAEPLVSNVEDQMDTLTDATLQKEFHAAMRSIYQSALASCGYKATRFLQKWEPRAEKAPVSNWRSAAPCNGCL